MFKFSEVNKNKVSNREDREKEYEQLTLSMWNGGEDK